VHQSGRFVIVSNRGHESITIFRVNQGNSKKGGLATRGTLSQVGFFHTRGETPRHFQFDNSGQYLIVANQDSDTIAVFSFNLTSGEIKYTGNEVSLDIISRSTNCNYYVEKTMVSLTLDAFFSSSRVSIK